MSTDLLYLDRCFQLAQLAGRNTGSNPMVGAVLVADNEIIGEGFHKKYGGDHAEIDCLKSVLPVHKSKIKGATMYVSLEPCSHHGKTPPCSERIIQEGISKVVIASYDPNEVVFGKGVKKLEAAGVEVVISPPSQDAQNLLEVFKKSLLGLPYIILKIVKSKDGFIGSTNQQVWLSNPYVRTITHKWRAEIDGILIGRQTAITDNPSLTTRMWPGSDPIRIVWDSHLKIPTHFHLNDGSVKTIILNKIKEEESGQIYFKNVSGQGLKDILHDLFKLGITRMLIEGGSETINHFISSGLWDEARVITTPKMLDTGEYTDLVKASEVVGTPLSSQNIYGNLLEIIKKPTEIL